MKKRLHFKNKKLIGIDSGESVITTDGQATIEIEVSVIGADEIIVITTGEEEIEKNFDKVTLSSNKEILIDGKKINKSPK